MEPNPSTTVTCLPLLSAAECDAALDRLAAAAWAEGRVAVPGGPAARAELRRCELATVDDAALVARVRARVAEVNRDLFQFALTGAAAADPPQAMRYPVGGHFDWHIDCATLATATRKLSFTVQLTDPAAYDGGDLELALYPEPTYRAALRQRGHLAIFPSFHLHRVAPVTRGTRVALVGWLHGPRFT